MSPVASRGGAALERRATAIRPAARARPHQASRHTAQLLAQIACALHWFNPLVWFAAWRLGLERERACDDLVLASGVRPSAYAGHLLEIVTGLLARPLDAVLRARDGPQVVARRPPRRRTQRKP